MDRLTEEGMEREKKREQKNQGAPEKQRSKRYWLDSELSVWGCSCFIYIGWNSNTLDTWCEELTHWKNPDAGKDWRREEKGPVWMRQLDGITDSMDMHLSKLRSWWWTRKPGMLQSMGSQEVGHDWETELNWKMFFTNWQSHLLLC